MPEEQLQIFVDTNIGCYLIFEYMMRVKTILAAISAICSLVQGLPSSEHSISARQSTNRLVFAHFMVR